MQHVEELYSTEEMKNTTREFLQANSTISAHSPKTSSLLSRRRASWLRAR